MYQKYVFILVHILNWNEFKNGDRYYDVSLCGTTVVFGKEQQHSLLGESKQLLAVV